MCIWSCTDCVCPVYFAINRPKTCVVSNRQVKMLFSAIALVGRAKRALHTSESQLRSGIYMFKSPKFKGQCVSIPSGYVQTSTLARAGLHVLAFFAHNIIL